MTAFSGPAKDESWVILARLLRPQGRYGEVLAEILTDFPDSFAHRTRLFLKPPGGAVAIREVTLERFWHHKHRLVLKFADVDSIDAAQKLRGSEVVVPIEERVPLDDDAVYVSDLIGSRVIDISRGVAQDIGVIEDVIPEEISPAMLMVNTGAPEPLLIPFVRAYLRRVDLANKYLEMALPDGLLTVDAPLTEEEQKRMHEGEHA